MSTAGNGSCAMAVLDQASLKGTPCAWLALAELAQITYKTSWGLEQHAPDVLVFHRRQKDPGCLGSPILGCKSWLFRSITWHSYTYLPVVMNVALALTTDWQRLVPENTTNWSDIRVSVKDDPGQWNVLQANSLWISFTWIVCILSSGSLMAAIPSLISTWRNEGLLFSEPRTIMFIAALISSIRIPIHHQSDALRLVDPIRVSIHLLHPLLSRLHLPPHLLDSNPSPVHQHDRLPCLPWHFDFLCDPHPHQIRHCRRELL